MLHEVVYDPVQAEPASGKNDLKIAAKPRDHIVSNEDTGGQTQDFYRQARAA